MSDQKFLLYQTPAVSHHIQVNGDLSAVLSMDVKLELPSHVRHDLLDFLESVIADESKQRAYRGKEYVFTYNPTSDALHKFIISHNVSGHSIGMTYIAAYNLFDALSGRLKDLKKED